MLQKGDYVLTKRSIKESEALKQDNRGVACVHSCIDIGAAEPGTVETWHVHIRAYAWRETEETEVVRVPVKALERLLLCRTCAGRYG